MLIDVVNEKNSPIEVIDRAKVLETGKNFRTVHAWLMDRHGKIVLQRLAADHRRSPNLMGSSVAGYLHAGESTDDAIRRKARSEVGQVPRELRMLGTISMTDVQSTKFVTLYIGTLQYEPKTQDSQIESFALLSLESLRRSFTRSPGHFTATFRALYERFGDSELKQSR